MRDEAPWQQLSAVGTLSSLIVGRRGFTGASEDAERAPLRRSMEPWRNPEGCVLADNLHTPLKNARLIVASGLYYILSVKGKQPLILKQWCDEYQWTGAAHSESGLGHGRIKRRTIQVSPELATPSLLRPRSGLYWTIENRMHYVLGTVLREVACRVRKGFLPQVSGAFANLSISVLRLLDKRNLNRSMSDFKLRRNTAVWSAVAARPPPAKGRGAPIRGNRYAEGCLTASKGVPTPRSGTPQPLWTGIFVGDRGRKTR